MFIESAGSNIIKQIILLKEKKYRDESGLFIVEGRKQISEIPTNWEIKYVVFSDKNAKTDFPLSYYTTEKIFKKISDTTTPQGILAVVKKQKYDTAAILSVSKGIFVVIDALQDPGNVGTIIRTAHAYGVKGIFVLKNSIDVFSGKVVRSTAGSIFKVPIIQQCEPESLITELKNNKIKTYGLSLKSDKFISDVKFANKSAIIVGNEAKGISENILKRTDDIIKIKMFADINSLNASVACSIAIYEISKQIN